MLIAMNSHEKKLLYIYAPFAPYKKLIIISFNHSLLIFKDLIILSWNIIKNKDIRIKLKLLTSSYIFILFNQYIFIL